MTSISDVLGTQTEIPLPTEYIEAIKGAVRSLVHGLQDSLDWATSAFATIL